MRIRCDNLLQFLLVAIALVGYWPVIGFENTLKWDIIDQYFPWRMFIVECLRSGVFPLWNPYEQLGTPIFADPQSGYWYAPVWLSALFGEYTLRSVQVEFFFHVALGGLGMFRLLRSVETKPGFAFLLSLAYVFSGFFIGNAQHLTYVVTGCWLPFVLWSFKALLTRRGLKHILRFGLFMWLMVTGGYPAFSIILFYVLALLWLIRIWDLRGDGVELKGLLNRSFGSALLLSILLSGLVFTLWQGRSFFSRTEGLDYPVAAFGPFSPQSVISFLFPLAAVRDPEFFNTDISMSSAYLGSFVLVGFILFLFRRKSRKEWFLLAAVVFFLLASFGRYSPVHRFLYEYVPMMDWFRFPSVFRLFAMIGMVLASGLALSKLSDVRPFLRVQTIIVVLLVWVFFRFGGFAAIHLPPSAGADAWFREVDFGQAMVLQCTSLLVLLGAGLMVGFMKLKPKTNLMVIGAIGAIEIVAFARMNMPVTVVSEYHTDVAQHDLDSARTRGFPVPAMRPLILNQDEGPFPAPFWKNLNLFRKQPAWDGYNNFQLRGYVRFFDQEELRSAQLSRTWVSFADTVVAFRDTICPAPSGAKSIAYLDESSLSGAPCGLSHTGNRITVIGFEPGRVELRADVESDSGLVVVMQQYYPGWEVRVDGIPATPVTSDYLFQSVWLRKGCRNVEWVYGNKTVRMLTVLGFITGFICILGLSMNRLNVIGNHLKQRSSEQDS